MNIDPDLVELGAPAGKAMSVGSAVCTCCFVAKNYGKLFRRSSNRRFAGSGRLRTGRGEIGPLAGTSALARHLLAPHGPKQEPFLRRVGRALQWQIR